MVWTVGVNKGESNHGSAIYYTLQVLTTLVGKLSNVCTNEQEWLRKKQEKLREELRSKRQAEKQKEEKKREVHKMRCYVEEKTAASFAFCFILFLLCFKQGSYIETTVSFPSEP